ncbi:MAG: hypothetical protein ACPGSM_21335, partial [Thiolinea sp.]
MTKITKYLSTSYLYLHQWLLLTLLFWSLAILTVNAAVPDFRQISVRGAMAGAAIKTLSTTEFISLQTNPQQATRTWVGLISQLQSSQPVVHIIDSRFYSDRQQLGFRSKFGIHEAYARYHGLARDSGDFIRQVSISGQQKQLMPFTLHLPPSGSQLNGHNIHWVFQNRRYRYRDSSRDFTQLLIRSQQAISKQLFPNMGTDFKPAFIAYNKTGTRRPNFKTVQGKQDIAALRQAGFRVISEAQLDTLAGVPDTQQVYVMNTGDKTTSGNYEAYGYLQHFTEVVTEDDINSLRPVDIAVFDALPERIPPVAGIIILEKQTALSHVNILAKNRGTLNISLHSTTPGLSSNHPDFLAAVIQGYKPDLTGKPVKLTLSGQQRLSIQPSSPAAVATFLAEQKAQRSGITISNPVITDSKRWL